MSTDQQMLEQQQPQQRLTLACTQLASMSEDQHKFDQQQRLTLARAQLASVQETLLTCAANDKHYTGYINRRLDDLLKFVVEAMELAERERARAAVLQAHKPVQRTSSTSSPRSPREMVDDYLLSLSRKGQNLTRMTSLGGHSMVPIMARETSDTAMSRATSDMTVDTDDTTSD